MRFVILASFLFIQSCAGFAPVPGGSETINKAYYENKEEFVGTLEKIKPGASEENVFKILNHNKDDLAYLKREEIIKSLYGSTAPRVNNEHSNSNAFLESIYGYRLFYKMTEREHGFASPIRIRTDESGFDYEVTLIFREGVLYGKPILSGGVVNKSNSATLFDLLTPSRMLDKAID